MNIQHPSPYRLTLWIVGDDPDPWLKEHIKSCDKCTKAIEKLADEKKDFLGSINKEDFILRAREKAEILKESQVAKEHPPSWKLRWAFTFVATAAAAALIIILISNSKRKPKILPKEKLVASADQGTSPQFSPKALVENWPIQNDLVVKGSRLYMTAVLVRKGSNNQKERHENKLQVSPGDIFYVEIKVSGKKPFNLLVALLDDGKDVYYLFENTSLKPGTYNSKKKLRVDNNPSPGVILAGSPKSVKEAIRTKKFKDVLVIRIEPKR